MFSNKKLGNYYFIALIIFIAVNITLMLIYEGNALQYVLFSVSFLLVIYAYLSGLIEGMIASLFGIFVFGTYILYGIIMTKTIRTLDIELIRWLVIFPIGAVVAGKYGELTREVFVKIDKYNKDMEDMVAIDELTGFSNEKKFLIDLEEEINRGKRYKTSLTVIIMKITYYDRLEAIYGKSMCSLVVKAMADRIDEILRLSDKKARIHQDEFGIILTNTDIQGADIVKGKLKQSLSQIALQDDKGGRKLNFTYKIGLAEMNGEDNVFSLINRAESELEYDI